MKHLLLSLIVFFASTVTGYTQTTNSLPKDRAEQWTSGSDLLEHLQSNYAGVEDYHVDIDAVLDIPGFRAPAMKAHAYFKQPDQFKVESDGFAMLPRDAVHFSPSMFDPEMFDAVTQGSEKVDGKDCIKLTLMARSETIRIQRATLFVETERLLILKIKLTPIGGAPATAKFSYTLVDNKHYLPATIEIDMPTPNRFRRKDSGEKKKKNTKDDMGHIELKYSNYRVNTGLPDSLFDSDN